MRLHVATWIGLSLLFAPAQTQAADGWSRLRLGMTAAQTAAALGEPLLRTAGQGFEVWIYDHSAEAVFYGPLIGWTAPGVGATSARTNDVWQAGAGRAATAGIPLPRPAHRRPAPKVGSPPGDPNKLTAYRLHY